MNRKHRSCSGDERHFAMAEPPKPNTDSHQPSSSSNVPSRGSNGQAGGQKISYPNPPDPTNPDPATLREQWRFAIKQYSRWYSHAWGTAILAGVSFFALGWIIKGSNPLPSFRTDGSSSDDAKKPRP